MWLTTRHLSIHPAVVAARLGRDENWPFRHQPDSLARLDEHLLRDIGVDPVKARASQPVPRAHASSSDTGSRGDRVATMLRRWDMAVHQAASAGSAVRSWLPSAVSRR